MMAPNNQRSKEESMQTRGFVAHAKSVIRRRFVPVIAFLAAVTLIVGLTTTVDMLQGRAAAQDDPTAAAQDTAIDNGTALEQPALDAAPTDAEQAPTTAEAPTQNEVPTTAEAPAPDTGLDLPTPEAENLTGEAVEPAPIPGGTGFRSRLSPESVDPSAESESSKVIPRINQSFGRVTTGGIYIVHRFQVAETVELTSIVANHPSVTMIASPTDAAKAVLLDGRAVSQTGTRTDAKTWTYTFNTPLRVEPGQTVEIHIPTSQSLISGWNISAYGTYPPPPVKTCEAGKGIDTTIHFGDGTSMPIHIPYMGDGSATQTRMPPRQPSFAERQRGQEVYVVTSAHRVVTATKPSCGDRT